MSNGATADDVASLVRESRIIVACGPGGVGKTTTAAALGVAVALREERRVLVLTVDPARRLADALGLAGIGNEVSEVPGEFFDPLGALPKGTLSVAMLDAALTWDALIRRTAASRDEAEEIISNPLYKNLTARFARGHEFIAMEWLYELSMNGEFDLLILDTPPSQAAVDFLDAPTRMAEFFSSRLLSWLTAPMRSRLVNFVSRPFTLLADRVLGTTFLANTARFFVLLENMYDGFVERAGAVAHLLEDPTTMFLIVTTPEEIPLDEASRLVEELARRRLRLGVLVANKVLPPLLRNPAAAALAARLCSGESSLDQLASPASAEEVATLSLVLKELGTNYLNFSALATHQAGLLVELARRHEVAVELPHLLDDVVDVTALGLLGDLLLELPPHTRPKEAHESPGRERGAR